MTQPGTDATHATAEDLGAYCREVEAHLCRVNGGHLVRIVGPAFDLVAGWARQGIPLRLVQHGVERTVTRLTARAPRRRPVRIEFCTADVLDAYDQWRRAVGVRAASAQPEQPDASDAAIATATPSPGRGPSLPRHLERVLVRLSSLRASRDLPPALAAAVDTAALAVDRCLDDSRGARGAARHAIVQVLESVQRELHDVAAEALQMDLRDRLRSQARSELASYRNQLSAEALTSAEDALFGQLVRKHWSLPQIAVDA